MSFDAILMIAAVIFMFMVFAGVLMWGDLQTRPARDKVIALPQKRRAF
jgi:hypothetical protein